MIELDLIKGNLKVYSSIYLDQKIVHIQIGKKIQKQNRYSRI